jgi:hypothetical protein
MGRTLAGIWRTGSLFGVRGKCRYSNHESVSLVGDQWMGESTGSLHCELAPTEPCEECGATGLVELTGDEAQLATYDEGAQALPGGRVRKPCPPCRGRGFRPGPHWPWRHPMPGPVQ